MVRHFYCTWSNDERRLLVHAVRHSDGLVVGKISSRYDKLSASLFDFITINSAVQIDWSPLNASA